MASKVIIIIAVVLCVLQIAYGARVPRAADDGGSPGGGGGGGSGGGGGGGGADGGGGGGFGDIINKLPKDFIKSFTNIVKNLSA
ncbi:unnamed protein product [Leptosia nina]|uniref:Uncharacterized protein n=1 Tax=Leptosia nina TaxID=320188 RepID=A0AAV1JWN4_9NEOP